ncbi:MAG: hypothetical protein IJR35_09700 [Synergistaceae bacterium]|nr:hypothetical protein [Synergistaceae bacterium]MBQ9405019.1 hypothetical protein [Synergistaceae bacterium]MBQ9596120.1 hypothetical protein [Synergistaceae bacterium]MBR0203100.1 hypothetical protein [Synergistaceae bacterium]
MRKVLKRLSAVFMLLVMLVTSIAVDVSPSEARVYRHRPARYRYVRRTRVRRIPRRRRTVRRRRVTRVRRYRRY